MSYKLMVARFPGQNQEHPRSSGYLMKLWPWLEKQADISNVIPFCLSDTPITMSRNQCVKLALSLGVDYILMIDSDMHPDLYPHAPEFFPEAWKFMMDRRAKETKYRIETERKMRAKYANTLGEKEHNLSGRFTDIELRGTYPPATIAAPYCGPPPQECVYVFHWRANESQTADPAYQLHMIDRNDAARREGIEEVAALPTGLILYDARVFRNLPKPWFDYEWADEEKSQKATTEDVYQTRNASLAHMPQFIHWSCWAGHIKLKTVGKPLPITTDMVRKDFEEAVLRGHRSDEKLVYQGAGEVIDEKDTENRI